MSDRVATPRVVTERGELDDAVDRFRDADRYAIDTEFHRERTYYPRLALVQLADADGTVIVDPLAVDPEPLCEVLEGPGTAILHAADQDLEVLEHACGAIPKKMFDTQVAAGFVGLTSPSLGDLVERVTGVRLPKASRLTDWLRRPLGDRELTYAAADVDHLLEVADALTSLLAEVGRLAWAEEECELLRTRARGPGRPEAAWSRLKETRNLRGPARGVAQQLAEWRERTAAHQDRPPRTVLPDMAILTIAQHPPADETELRQRRGVDGRHLARGAAAEILDAVRRGEQLSGAELPVPTRREIDRSLRPAVGLVSAWIGQLGRDLAIAPATLGTRADIEALLRNDEDARLARGWRAELVGEPVRRLVAGEVSLAFGGRRRLVLEERSGRPVEVDLAVPDADWLARR